MESTREPRLGATHHRAFASMGSRLARIHDAVRCIPLVRAIHARARREFFRAQRVAAARIPPGFLRHLRIL